MDTKPDPFTFAAVTGADLGAFVTSNAIIVSGINAPSPLTVSGRATLIVDGAASVAKSVAEGQTVALQLKTSDTYNTSVAATLTIGGVSATFTATTKAALPTVIVTNLADSGPGSLRQVILDARNGMRITFSPELAGQLTLLSQIFVDKSIEIDGPGNNIITVSGNRQNRLFLFGKPIDGSPIDVTLSRLSMAEGYISGNVDRSGGAIVVEPGATLRLKEVVIRDSDAGQSGGAVWNQGLLIVEGSELSNNTNSGSKGAGGAIYSSGELRINNSVLTNNRSINNFAGAIYATGKLSISDSEISANSSNGPGGAIYTGKSTEVDIANAFVHSNTASGDGGALYADESSVRIRDRSRFNSNTVLASVRKSGGAIYSNKGTLLIQDSTLSNNQANTSNNYQGGEGGAIFLYQTSKPRLIRVQMTGNTAQRNGGAIALGSLTMSISIEESELTGNSGVFGGGLFYNRNSNAEYFVASSTFADNTATSAGGGIYWSQGGQGQIRNSTFTGNTVRNGNGGAIWTSRQVTIIESTIVRNHASALGDGVSAAQVTLRNSIVAANGDSDIAGLSGQVTSNGYNLVGNGTNTGLVGGRNGDIVGSNAAPVDPQLGELEDNGGPTRTIAPLTGSPVIAHIPTGSNFSTVDQRGQPRPGRDGVSDVGAYESN